MAIRPVVRMMAVSVLLLVVVNSTGCSKSYDVGEVDGVLLTRGKPAQNVQIQFIPDIDKGTKGPLSVAETDANGGFTLELKDGDDTKLRPGAVVGWHRIALSDLRLAQSATGQGIPIRFGQKYTLPGSTPLRQEIKQGKQTIEIKVP
jgi:hypothetical protein